MGQGGRQSFLLRKRMSEVLVNQLLLQMESKRRRLSAMRLCGAQDDTAARRTEPSAYPAEPSCRTFLENLPAEPSWRTFLQNLPENLPGEPSCRTFLQNLPGEPSCRTFLQTLPGEPSWRTFLQNLPAEPSWRTFLQNLPGEPSWRTFLLMSQYSHVQLCSQTADLTSDLTAADGYRLLETFAPHQHEASEGELESAGGDPLSSTQKMMAVTPSKQWIHFFLSDRWPPTSTILKVSSLKVNLFSTMPVVMSRDRRMSTTVGMWYSLDRWKHSCTPESTHRRFMTPSSSPVISPLLSAGPVNANSCTAS
ncbi:hypothetical protein CRUP_018709 [Coryphaenoides rupestris]|nr:hypothetical protein CRUP_018709 [Coryphaenoides rupestris]